MKKRVVVINALLAVMVLFAMLFQSFHGLSHLEKQLAEKQCHHQYHSSAELTHQHHNFDHCLICEFTFSISVPASGFNFHIATSCYNVSTVFQINEKPLSFSGSLYALRGPPDFIV